MSPPVSPPVSSIAMKETTAIHHVTDALRIQRVETAPGRAPEAAILAVEPHHSPPTPSLASMSEPGDPDGNLSDQDKYTACFPNNSSLTALSLPGTRGDTVGHSDHKTLVFRAALETSPGDPISAVKDPPLGSHCELLLASTGASTAAEDEGRGTDENQRERRSTNECAPEYKQLKSRHGCSGVCVADIVKQFESMTDGLTHRDRIVGHKAPRSSILRTLLIMHGVHPRHLFPVAVNSSRCAYIFQTAPQKLTFDLLRISVEPKVEFGGRMERPTSIDSIGCVQYNILPPSPAPILAVGVHTVELGGRVDIPALTQQDITAAAETHTLHALDDPSSCGIPDLACTTSSSILPLSSSVLSSVKAYLDFALVSALTDTLDLVPRCILPRGRLAVPPMAAGGDRHPHLE
ncbi:hypothetical protein B0H14DRAFT_3453869 [Mycena olivaceomarginata]|nr:hypothetical protein B0H14DRAFT_3453869 [Mycena olivaceomarginata]